jgi:nicotinate phosphoribosyltransferase
VELAGAQLGAVRIDSGDLPVVARQVRTLLDSLGAPQTRIVLTGDLDEYSIAALAATPVDGYGVGTSLVTGSGAPTAALVYKLVARAQGGAASAPLRPVAKRSVGKPGRGGRKWALRRRDANGAAAAELVLTKQPDPPGNLQPGDPYDLRPGGPSGPGPGIRAGDRVLLRQLVSGGEIVGAEPLDAARARHRAAVAELPAHALQLSRGYPAIPTIFSPDARS